MSKSTLILFAMGIISLAGLSACNDDEPGGRTNTNDFDRQVMLEDMANQVILPAYLELNITTLGLESAINDFTAAPSQSTLDLAQASLKDAWLAWQGVNLFQFGPAESNGLRSALNNFPTDDRTIEANIEAGEYNLSSLSNLKAIGLPAIDYLLHGAEDAAIIDLYTTSETAAKRKAYLHDLAALVSERVSTTYGTWSPEAGNFATSFAENDGSAVGSSLSEMVNAFNLQYERYTRDSKIGIPAGVRSLGVPIPESTEAFYGGYSLELAIANLQAYKELFKGSDREGLDLGDYLISLNASNEAGALEEQINAQLDVCITALQNLDDPLSETIRNNNDEVLNSYVELQRLVVLLKAELPSAMGVTITFQDNDGD